MTRPFALVLIAFLCALVAILEDRWLFRHYWRRTCTGRGWKTRFPTSSARDIRDFLTIFADAFAFRKSRRLKFEPDDQVLTIYRTRYPGRGPDMLELETLVKQLKKRYGVDLVHQWHPAITLGEIFERVRKRAA